MLPVVIGSCRTAVNFVITADPGISSGNQAVCGINNNFSSTTTGGTYTSSAIE
jgi:hypothetical protein